MKKYNELGIDINKIDNYEGLLKEKKVLNNPFFI